MKISRRSLLPSEFDHELIWLSVSLSGLAAAATWFALHLPWPICLFHAITGHPRLTGGATRSAIAFFHANFFTAWQWNPLVFAALCALSIFDAYACIVLVAGRLRLRITNVGLREKFWIRSAIIALLAINWTYLLVANPSL